MNESSENLNKKKAREAVDPVALMSEIQGKVEPVADPKMESEIRELIQGIKDTLSGYGNKDEYKDARDFLTNYLMKLNTVMAALLEKKAKAPYSYKRNDNHPSR